MTQRIKQIARVLPWMLILISLIVVGKWGVRWAIQHHRANLPDEQVTITACPATPLNPWALNVIQLSDIHVGHANFVGDPRLKQAIALINRLQPDLVVVTGDITDNAVFNNAKGKEELTQYQQALQAVSVPVITLPGNHDLGYAYQHPGKPMHLANRAVNVAQYKTLIGSLNQQRTVHGYQFIALDNNPFVSRGHPTITAKQYQWVQQALETGLPTIVLGHLPLMEQGHLQPTSKDAKKLLALLEVSPNVLAFWNGHLHRMVAVRHRGITHITAPDLKYSGHHTVLLHQLQGYRLTTCQLTLP